MQKFIWLVLIVAMLATPTMTYAREAETPPEIWPDQSCIDTVYKIVAHEAGNTGDSVIFSFMTEQIMVDIDRMGCDHLTQWRWRIGNFPLSSVSEKVMVSVLNAVVRYPDPRYPHCKLVGMKPDLRVWASYGYNTTVGFERTVNHLTVVGADCVYPKNEE